MTIDQIKEKRNYTLTMKGSKADLDAFANILEKAVKRINVDLYPQEKDLPGRISVEKGTALQVTRVRKAMKKLAKGLKEEGRSVDIDFGTIRIESDPLKREELLAVMDAVTTKKPARGVRVAGPSVVSQFERIFEVREYAEEGAGPRSRAEIKADVEREWAKEGYKGGGRFGTFLSEMEMRWAHVEPLIESEMDVKLPKVRNMDDLAIVGQYPPKMKPKKLKAWAELKDYNRAYVVILELDRMFPLDARVYTKGGAWNEWIRMMPAGQSIMKSYDNKPPKTVADVLERIAAYAAGRAFDLEDVAIAPFDASKLGKVSLSDRAREKIWVWDNVLRKKKDRTTGESYPYYKHYIGFLVVGRGPYKPMGLTRVEPEDEGDIKLPDL